MFYLLNSIKCKKCPYKLGVIKCIENPCIKCQDSKRKKHPFPEADIKFNRKQVDKWDF